MPRASGRESERERAWARPPTSLSLFFSPPLHTGRPRRQVRRPGRRLPGHRGNHDGPGGEVRGHPGRGRRRGPGHRPGRGRPDHLQDVRKKRVSFPFFFVRGPARSVRGRGGGGAVPCRPRSLKAGSQSKKKKKNEKKTGLRGCGDGSGCEGCSGFCLVSPSAPLLPLAPSPPDTQ